MHRLVIATIAALAVALAAAPARAGEEAAAPAATGSNITAEVTVSFPDGRTLDATLLAGSKDGSIKIKSPYGEQTLTRNDWTKVEPKQRPAEFALAQQMYDSKHYDAAAKKYQEIYDKYESLYIFGAEALDGEGQAQMALGRYKEALDVYEQLFQEYSGADLTYQRRYNYARCLGQVGGKDNTEKAITQLEAVVAATDDVTTVRALYQLGKIQYAAGKNYLALRAFMQVFILYRSYRGEGAAEVQALVKSSLENAITCCDNLSKTSDPGIKRRVDEIRARLVRAKQG
jgi:tetratricopeptide (TPR) repeat protein